MKLGAQFFSLRDMTKTPEGIRASFAEMKKIGYDIAQMSAIGPIAAEELRDISEEFAMPITCTHSPFARITDDTDALIKEHITYGCPVIGLGSMPNEYRDSLEGVRAFMEKSREAAKRIQAAGLRFAYHNHAFEFVDLGGVHGMDLLIEEFPELNFILDTYWVKFAGYDYLEYIKRIGPARMTNVHFKDMKTEPKGEICPCGVGTIDFAPVVKLCDDLKIPYALVEQDNAPESGDSYGQMAISYANLKHLFK